MPGREGAPLRHLNRYGKLALCILLSAVIFCGSGMLLRFAGRTKETARTGESLRLDWYIDSSGVSIRKEWSQYPLMKEISERTGVEPKLLVAGKNKSEKLDIMIASDNFPDLLTLDMDNVYANKLIRLKKVRAVGELVDLYVPRLKKEIDAALWKDMMYDDAKPYMIPGHYIPGELYRRREGMGVYTYNVRKDIYTDMGSPDMSTPEKFTAALRLFKQRYPTVEGKPSIPVSLVGTEDKQIEILERSFGVKEYYEDGKNGLQIKYKNPAYIQVVQFLNSLYREGLMDPLAFIKKREQIAEDLEKGRIFAIPAKYSSLKQVNASLNRNRDGSNYIAVAPMEAVEGVTFPGKNRFGTTGTLISSTSAKTEAAMKFVGYLWSKEGTLLLHYGHPGADYTTDGAAVKRAGQAKRQRKLDSSEFAQRTGISVFTMFFYPHPGTRCADAEEGDALLAQQAADQYMDAGNPYLKNINPDYGLPIGRIKSNLEDIIQRDFPMAVMAESETTAVAFFKSMLLKLEQSGLEKLELYWTQRHELNLSR